MQYLEIITLFVSGWLAGAESGSWAFVHPVIHQLDPEKLLRLRPVLFIAEPLATS